MGVMFSAGFHWLAFTRGKMAVAKASLTVQVLGLFGA